MIHVLILSIGVLLSQFLHSEWWSFAVVVFVWSCAFSKSKKHAFFLPSVILLAMWLIMAIALDRSANWEISRRTAGLFSLPSQYWMYFPGAILAGIVSGFSGLSGWFFWRSFSFVSKRKIQSLT